MCLATVSRLVPVAAWAPLPARPSHNSARGCEVKRCRDCVNAVRDTKQVVHNGMTLLRIRYGVPYVEFPDVNPGELNRLLLFLLLQGKERPSVVFPRAQRGVRNSPDGLCRLQRLCRKDRWSLAHGLASIKRNLPAGCKRHTPSARPGWEAAVLSPPPPPPSEYLDHVRRVCTRLFPAGWSRLYENFVNSHLPNPSARKPLFSRADQLWAGRREEFLTKCLRETDLSPVFMARYKEVASAGKCRPLLIFDENVDLLAPLHKMLYSYLRRQPWLLCGPPTEKRMESVLVNACQTSVDLVAATDGLHHSVAEAILSTAFFSSVEVPRSVRALASASLSPLFRDRANVLRRVRHGQMMGAYLSFPLLCIQSYCAALWAARFDQTATFLVNGDDCVISASRGITVQDYPPGFRLNSDKTIVAGNVAEVNSTAFLKIGRKWREVRHLRRGGAPTDYEGMLHMVKAVKAAGRAFEDAFVYSRIGRRWGFLPSQLGIACYPAWRRQVSMLVGKRRSHSVLPTSSVPQDESGLRRIYGRDPTDEESEALRGALWISGRRGGLKRDVFSPSCGKIRRTYHYLAKPYSFLLSYVCWARTVKSAPGNRSSFFLVPDEFETEEERVALWRLELLRRELVRGSS